MNSSVFWLQSSLFPPYFNPMTKIAPDTAPQSSAHLAPLFNPADTLNAVSLLIPYFSEKAPSTAWEQYSPLPNISDALFSSPPIPRPTDTNGLLRF
jgi:hypothetical protein